MIIYLMGIDGAGKSTIADLIKNKLENTAQCEIVWARYQPKLVKNIIKPFRKKKVSTSTDYNNMSAEEYASWTKMKKNKLKKHPYLAKILFWIQFLEYKNQIKNIFREKGNKHIIVDRYVLDFLVDQTVNYGDIKNSIITQKLLKKLSYFDKILFINVDSEIAFKRKKDIPSIEYLNERRTIYMNYINILPNAYVVDNNSDIQETINTIYKILAI